MTDGQTERYPCKEIEKDREIEKLLQENTQGGKSLSERYTDTRIVTLTDWYIGKQRDKDREIDRQST